MVVSYKYISSRLEIILIPVFSGLITAILPVLIAVTLAFGSTDFLYIAIIVMFICLIIAFLGGLLAYIVLSLIRKIRHKSV